MPQGARPHFSESEKAMKNSFYIIAASIATLCVCCAACGKSAKEQAEQAKQDSIDSVRSADSVFDAQTRHMLALDTMLEHRADSLAHARKNAPTVDLEKDAEPFVKRVMADYVRALNRGANVSTKIGGDVTNKVLSQLTDMNGGPSQATDEAGKPVRYELKSVKAAADHWFEVAWTRGGKPFKATLRVAMNGPRKLRIEELK